MDHWLQGLGRAAGPAAERPGRHRGAVAARGPQGFVLYFTTGCTTCRTAGQSSVRAVQLVAACAPHLKAEPRGSPLFRAVGRRAPDKHQL
jgi:hypothetical protein